MIEIIQIRKLKQRKLEKAESELVIAIQELRKCKKNYEKKHKESEVKISQARIEEVRLFEKIENQAINNAKLNDIRVTIASHYQIAAETKTKALELKKMMLEAEQLKNSCQIKVNRCKKDVEKYHQLNEELLKNSKLISERKSENDLDEFSSVIKR